MTDPLLVLRSEFPILERTTYLASNTLGAMPRSVPDRLAEYVDTWAERGVRAWQEGWGELGTRVADEIAPLIGASSGEIVMVPNDTLAQSMVISAVPYTPQRNRIVMTELDFPSVRYAHEMLATRFGAEIVVVPSHDGITVEREELLAAIDERTALVAISEVSYRSAFVHDVGAIVAHAHGVGALVCADSFHAVGAIPVDVKATHVDFLTGGVLKWLCGGPGGCFLYVQPFAMPSRRPSQVGWRMHALFPSKMTWRTRMGSPGGWGEHLTSRRCTRRSRGRGWFARQGWTRFGPKASGRRLSWSPWRPSGALRCPRRFTPSSALVWCLSPSPMRSRFPGT